MSPRPSRPVCHWTTSITRVSRHFATVVLPAMTMPGLLDRSPGRYHHIMEYTDPLQLYCFDQAIHWVYNPDESIFGSTVFDSYAQIDRKLTISVIPTRGGIGVPITEWLCGASAYLKDRWLAEIDFTLLPEKSTAIGGRMLDDGRRLRALLFAGPGYDVAVCETSRDTDDGPELNENMALIRSSLYLVDVNYDDSDDPDGGVRAGLFRIARGELVQFQRTPITSLVFSMSAVVTKIATGLQAPILLGEAELFTRLQMNTRRGELSAGSSEYQLLERAKSDVYSTLKQLLKEADATYQTPKNSLEFAFVIAELLTSMLELVPPKAGMSELLELALSLYLVALRRELGLLSSLFATDAASAPSGMIDLDERLLTILGRIAYVAGRAADERSGSDDRRLAAEADRVSIAALRLLRAHNADYVLDSKTVDGRLGDRLFLAAEHLSASNDRLTLLEAEAFRREAAQFDPREGDGPLTRVGLGQWRGFLAAVEDQRTDDARRIADMMLDPSLEDVGQHPIAEQIGRAHIARMLGNRAEMTEAVDAALSLMGIPLDSRALASPRIAKRRWKFAHKPRRKSDAKSEMARAKEFLSLSYALRALGRHEEALLLLNHAAEIIGRIAPIGKVSMEVLDAAAWTVSADNGMLAARLSIGAAAVVDGLRLDQITGEGRTRYADDAETERVYENAVTRNLDQKRYFEALCMADRARGRSLFEAVRGGGKVISSAHRRSAAWPSDSGSSPLERLCTEVLKGVSDRYGATVTPIPLLPEQLMTIGLHSGNFLIPQPLDGELALFVLGGEGIIHVERIPADLGRLEDQVQQVRDAMRVHAVVRGEPGEILPASVATDSLLRELYNALIVPIKERLIPSRPLIVVPHRDLALLPWALLIGPDGRRLIDDFQIAITPSLSTWDALWQRGWGPPVHAYVAADPLLEPLLRARGLGPLRSARFDAERIRRRLEPVSGQGQAPIIVAGPDATESSYYTNAPRKTLIHMACHAALREPATDSCLYLAKDAKYDGRLTAAEVSRTPLDRAVVFLAACDTGQGRLSSDGVLGLGQAFLDAGAQAVVLTLWKVADSVTSVLSEHFYERLLEPDGTQTVSAALRAAMLTTREDLESGRIADDDGKVLPSEPQLWGAFFVLGRQDAYFNIEKQDQ